MNPFRKPLNIIFIATCLLCLPWPLHAQPKTPEVAASLTTLAGQGTPFWLISNRQGKISTDPAMAALTLTAFARPDTGKVFDIHYGAELYARQGRSGDLWLHQLYAGITWRDLLELRAGLWEEVIGSREPRLSTGSIIWSGNARPVPKVHIATPGYINIPYSKGYAEVSGLLSQGWFVDDRFVSNVLLHHKNIYFRLGGTLPVNIYYGFNHIGMWGGKSPLYDLPFPTGLDSYYRIFFNRSGKTSIPGTPPTWENHKFGNTLASRNYGIDLNLQSVSAGAYYQEIIEDGSGKRRRNFPDGLWGAFLRITDKPRLLQAIVYEYLQTTDQSGPTHNDEDGNIIGGNDNYFNHAIYQSGWTYYGHTIGTPLITSPVHNGLERFSGLPAHRIHNNRVRAHHLGFEGTLLSNWNYRSLITWSRNYGRHSVPFDNPADQLSVMLEVSRQLPRHGLQLSLTIAADRGELYGDNHGLMLNVRKNLTFNDDLNR